MRKSATHLLLCAAVCLLAGSAYGGFTRIEDFTGLSGNIHGQNAWVAEGTSSQVVTDPADANNQVLAITTDSTRLYKPLTIADGSTRMLFLRFRFHDQPTYSFGMSDMAHPDQFGDFESELSQSNVSHELSINNTNGPGYLTLRTLAPDTWYNLWMLIDNATDDTQVYLHARPGEGATAADQLKFGTQSVFDFRDGVAADLRTLFIKTGGGSSQHAGPLYLDDIHLETTATLNLSNPTVPEPGTTGSLLLLLGLGML